MNLGCLAGTVVSKNKGARFLSQPDVLKAFLDEIFSNADIKISVKTRIGMQSRDEFPILMDVFN